MFQTRKRKRTNGNGVSRAFKKPRTVQASASSVRMRTSRSISNARIGGFLGIENKFYDQKLTASALTAPGDATGGEHDPSATILLNTVVQGDGESNRDGRNITMNSIHLNGTIQINDQINQTAQPTAGTVFIALVLDMQTNGATISSENVYKNKSASGALAASPFRNLQFIKRFKVLKTKQIKLPPMESTYDGTNIELAGYNVPWKMNVQLNGLKTNFTSTTEDVANIVDNSLHIIAWTSNTDQAPLIYYNSRLRFFG